MKSQTPTGNADFAVASLVLGLVGLSIPLLGILAITFARRAKKLIRANPTLSGNGIATAGEILGWVEIGLIVVALAVILLGPLVSSF